VNLEDPLSERESDQPIPPPALHNWQNGRKVSRRSKRMAAISMTVCAVILFRVAETRSWASWLAMACMASVLAWLWCRPEPDSEPDF